MLAAVMPPAEMGCRVLKPVWLLLAVGFGSADPREEQEGPLVKGRRDVGRSEISDVVQSLSCRVYYEF